MPESNGDDFQEISQATEGEQPEVEIELEAGPRAERPNFLTATRFVDFDLPPEILEGLDKAGFEYCTPIQAQAIPVAMKGEDIAGQAQTGTGKTTAFLVPLLNRLMNSKPLEPDVPRAIIVTPTRELALQIHEDATVLAGGTNLRQVLVIGGIDYKEQAELLSAGPEIVICTPGRIIDYLQQGVFKTKGIEVAVVDEADRLLDMGFIKDLKYLLGKLPPFSKRQTMLFSATLDERVLELTYQYMNPPQYITAEPDINTKVNIVQELYHVGRDEKLSLLMGLLRREEHRRIIIFVNTKSGVEWLSKKLTLNGFQAEGITGDLPQPKRLKLMESFKENRLQILVATDVASRGIHVDDVSHVYNYDLPQDAENYVHRIGRTARAGHDGKAVSFGCEDYVFHLEAIENLLGEKIPVFWAEADWFAADQGGEVHIKDRRGDRKKSSSGPARGGRGEGGERRAPRGPAKSHRPGGIFGLSPRLTGEGPDLRQTLAWSEVEDIPAPPPAQALSQEEAAPVAENGENGEKENGRRRKRRRGRRGRGGEAVAPAAEAAASAEAAAPAAPAPDAKADAKPVEEQKASSGVEKKSSPKGRRSSASKPAAAKAPAAPAPKAESPAPSADASSTEAQAKKPRRGTSGKAGDEAAPAKKTAASSRAKAEAADAPAVSAEAEKPKKSPARKTAAPKAKAAESPAAPPAETESPAKKPRRSTKTAETAAKAGESASTEAAPKTRKTAAKKSEAAPAEEKAKKPAARAKKADAETKAAASPKTAERAKKSDSAAPAAKKPASGRKTTAAKKSPADKDKTPA